MHAEAATGCNATLRGCNISKCKDSEAFVSSDIICAARLVASQPLTLPHPMHKQERMATELDRQRATREASSYATNLTYDKRGSLPHASACAQEPCHSYDA